MHMSRTTALAIALLACTAVLPAFADDTPAERKAPRSERPEPTTGSRIPDSQLVELDDVHVIGALNDPADAGIADDSALPDLPVVVASTPRGR